MGGDYIFKSPQVTTPTHHLLSSWVERWTVGGELELKSPPINRMFLNTYLYWWRRVESYLINFIPYPLLRRVATLRHPLPAGCWSAYFPWCFSF